MSGQAINSIATIIKRLEAATSRLEDLAAGPGAVAGPTTPSASASSRAVAADAGPSSNAPASDPPAVAAFDDYLEQPLKDYADMSERIGGLVAQQAKQVVAAFQAQRSLVKLASSCSKPSGGVSSPIFANLLKPLQESLMAVTDVREKNRSERVLFNHLSAVSEGIPAVGWVAVEPKPGPFVGEMKDSAQFYTNRVIKEFKDKDKTHVEWCRAFIKIFDALKDYIMKTHTTGLSWNPSGGDAATYTDSSPAAAAVPPPPPPPPAPQAGFDGGAPPPPPPPPAAAAAGAGAAAAGGIDAVFAQLNQGEGITRSLKKVDASQMTHKNPELRSAAAAPAAPSSSSSSKPAPPKPGSKPSALRPKKPANTALEGNKWTVEYHDNNPSVIIDATELNQTVNIYGCKNTVVQIKGKINAVAMVSCQKTSILVDTLVSSLEITSSPSFAVQVTGNVPTILLDSCDSGQIYLAKTAMGAEIVASKCSALNVSVPKEGAEEEGEYTELALPEQLRFGVAGGKLRSEVVAHTG